MTDAELRAWRERQRSATLEEIRRLLAVERRRPWRQGQMRSITLVDLAAWREALERPDPDGAA